jgi:hypothetical protein
VGFWLLPSPELEYSVALCIDLETNYGKSSRKGLLKMFAIPGLDIENTFLVHGRVPPMSDLMR